MGKCTSRFLLNENFMFLNIKRLRRRLAKRASVREEEKLKQNPPRPKADFKFVLLHVTIIHDCHKTTHQGNL